MHELVFIFIISVEEVDFLVDKINKAAEVDHEGAKKLATYWVGQGIGLVDEKITAGQTVQKFKEEFIEAYERLNSFME